jgi:hypothetical protein
MRWRETNQSDGWNKDGTARVNDRVVICDLPGGGEVRVTPHDDGTWNWMAFGAGGNLVDCGFGFPTVDAAKSDAEALT